jgi:hypothetical protein
LSKLHPDEMTPKPAPAASARDSSVSLVCYLASIAASAWQQPRISPGSTKTDRAVKIAAVGIAARRGDAPGNGKNVQYSDSCWPHRTCAAAVAA